MFEKLKEKRAKKSWKGRENIKKVQRKIIKKVQRKINQSRMFRPIKKRIAVSPSRVVHEAFMSGDLETLSMIFGAKTLDANNQIENDVENPAMQEDAG